MAVGNISYIKITGPRTLNRLNGIGVGCTSTHHTDNRVQVMHREKDRVYLVTYWKRSKALRVFCYFRPPFYAGRSTKVMHDHSPWNKITQDLVKSVKEKERTLSDANAAIGIR